MQSLKVAICPGSFDPVTLGHMDIINRARRIFDHVIVAVMLNPAKNTMFTVEERIELLRKCTVDMADVEVVGFEGCLQIMLKSVMQRQLSRGCGPFQTLSTSFKWP